MDKKRLQELAGIPKSKKVPEELLFEVGGFMFGDTSEQLISQLRDVVSFARQRGYNQAADWITEMWVEYRQEFSNNNQETK